MAVKNSGIVARQTQQTKAAAANGAGQDQQKSIRQLILSYKNQIAMALPQVMTPERFTRIALSAIGNNPKLQECTQMSFLGALMNAAQLGLEPNTPIGEAYLIPYWNSKARVFECQFQLGTRGLITLAYRSGNVQNIQARTVREADIFDFSFGSSQHLDHVPVRGDRGEAIYVWASYSMTSGAFVFDVMSMDEVRDHADQFSQSYKTGKHSPWQTHFNEMAQKTVLKRLLKRAPMSSDFVRATSTDETISTLVIPEDRRSEAVIETSVPDIVTDADDITAFHSPIEVTAEIISTEATPDPATV